MGSWRTRDTSTLYLQPRPCLDIWFTEHLSQRDSPESNVALSIARWGGHCRGGSIIDPTTHAVFDSTDDETGVTDQIGCDDDSSHNIYERSDSTSASSTAASNAESLPDQGAQSPSQVSPSQMPSWHDMAVLANSNSTSHPKEDNGHGFGYEMLKLMCRASRKFVAIGSIMVIGYGHV